ncbi:MAG: hypothetical protein WC285_00805 [Candidatus Gracilibacteria bacterium]|jgi:hypothetical protein
MTKFNAKKSLLVILIALTAFGFICQTQVALAEKVTENLTPIISNPDYTGELGNVDSLPKVSLDGAVATIIKTVLRVSFFLTLISLVVASVYYIISMGKEESITKARDIVLYLVIGMTIIAAAYGIIAGISRFNFFSVEVDQNAPTTPDEQAAR